MNILFKGVALFVAITCGVWVAVLWHWESTSRDMNTRDIVVYLGLLPLTVFALALLLRWAWRGAMLRQAALVAAASAAPLAGATAATGEAGADEARSRATVQLLAAHVVCAAGESAADIQQAAHEGQPRPALDAHLRDEAGLPVFTARIADLDVAGFVAQLEPLLKTTRLKRPEWAELAPPEHVQRALAALQRPLTNAVASLGPWSSRFQPAPDAQRGQAPETRVRLLLGWPADWTAFEQDLGSAVVSEWIAAEVNGEASGEVGGEVSASIPAACFVQTSHACSGEDLMLHADRLLQTLAREGRDEPVIVAACHSGIGEAAIETLERNGTLFSAQSRPRGRMPGEAAAALVFAGARWPVDPTADRPPQHVHRPAVFRRDKSVDVPGRVNGEITLQALTQAVAVSELSADAMGAFTCDADQHTARGDEFFSGGRGFLQHLDSGEDMRLIGTVTGSVGAVGALLVVACAADTARATEKPCLAATMGDPFARLAMVVLPALPAALMPKTVEVSTQTKL